MTLATEPLAAADADDRYAALLDRLNDLSVTKHFDAYADIDWSAPEMALDPTDPIWELGSTDPLGSTSWYQALPQERRARLGCDLVASKMKTGLIFENILQRGLLEFAMTLPNNSSEFRYAYHEVIEEAQHTLMFQEFVNRSGLDAGGLSFFDRLSSRWIVSLGRRFPQLFFLFVLGGEDPIDYVQRRELRSDRELHPLLERIMRIHVTEEARHLSFARHYLLRTVPELSGRRKIALAVGCPLILGQMAQLMLKPSAQIVRSHQIPDDVIRAAFTDNPAHHGETIASLKKVRDLCIELGLLRRPFPRLWDALGLTAR
ncbi:MAG: diiron oxygenase [Mycobacteriales bacterium]